MAKLSTIKSKTVRKTVLYCPACKKVLKQSANNYSCLTCRRSFPIINGIPSLIIQRASVDSFDASAFEFLFQMEQTHFWHIGRREIILDVLKRNVPDLISSRMLEVGCGNGSVLAYLKQNGINIEGGDFYIEGLAFCRLRVKGVPLYQLDVLTLPFNSEFDVIGAFDVIEHIDDDVQALTEIKQSLKQGGTVAITVPAHRFLWSRSDEIANHQRRYSKQELVTKLQNAGFTVRKTSYFMFFLFPLLAAMRLIGKARTDSSNNGKVSSECLELKTIPVLNAMFLGILRFERFLLRYFNLPFGASLIVLAEKK